MSRRNDSDDENDSCVFVGTPLVDLLPEDAKFSVKPKRPDEQIVTDEKGRQRFHGAFTGGFSAGYFNTVGSKDGWAPSTFQSSRKDRASNNGKFQRPEDFMDEEDFEDHGIAPRTLKVKSDYKETFNKYEGTIAAKKDKATLFIDDLIRPVRNTIGVKMLRKMGWREGTGIGPKIKRKLRKLKSKQTFEPGRKIYGVALPSASDESDLDELEDDILVSTFDVNEFQFKIKEDLFGLGYKRLDVNQILGKTSSNQQVDESPAASLLFPMMANQKKINKNSISGQAFGVGEWEDEEDVDIYQQDSIEKYDFGLDSKKQSANTRNLLNKSYGFGAFDDDISIMNKFAKSSKKLQPAKYFPPPEVPPNFNLRHKFPNDSDSQKLNETQTKSSDPMNVYIKSVSERSSLLGEEVIKPDSVFDLISASDREFLERQKQKALSRETKKSDDTVIDRPMQSPKDSIKEQKTKRYQEFKSYIGKNYKDPYNFLDTKEMTEWERQNEKKEFYKMYEQSKQIEKMRLENVNKFVSVSVLNEQNVEQENVSAAKPKTTDVSDASVKEKPIIEEELSEMERAAKENKHGKLTRVEYEWRPHPTVCKRFNIPNPYKDAKEYGTVGMDKRKATKFSLFNVLANEARFDKAKSKSLFDEINSDMPVKQGASNAKTIIMIDNTKEGESKEKPKIEFETKESGASETKSEFAKLMESKEKLDVAKPTARTDRTESTINENNVYLQERPPIDLFKAIFEDEDEDEDEKEEAKEDEEEEESDKDETETKAIDVDSAEEISTIQSATVVPSSFSKIDLNEVKKYTKMDDYEETGKYSGEKPKLPEPVKFAQVLKNLAESSSKSKKKSKKKKKKKTSGTRESDDEATSSEKSSSSSSTTSSESDDSDIEIVYEEVSISNSKSSSHKKSKSSSKKKKHKKKKSKHGKKSKDED